MKDALPEKICGLSPQTYFSALEKRFSGDCRDVFLMNPHWTEAQRRDADALAGRFAERSRSRADAAGDCFGARIFIASGGSGGRVRFVAHTQKTLEASARGLIGFLKLPAGTPLNCFACLPPWHVSGLMPFVRARVSGGKLFVAERGGFHEGEAFPQFRSAPDEFWMNSLVPTQLRRILSRGGGAEWLRGFDFILLGGAAVPEELIARAAEEKLNVGVGYGMTETASLVALWMAREGGAIAGTPLPHAEFFISREDSRISVASSSLGETLGGNGELLPNPGGVFRTNDEGLLDERGRLVVLGRADRYINSGGEKIDPAIVEKALLEAGARAALVIGEADAEWGERVVALVVRPVPADILPRVRRLLPAQSVPKRLISVPALPFDEKGKLDRAALREALAGGDAS